MNNLINIVLVVILICVIIQKYREYCNNKQYTLETYNERFGIVPESHENFDVIKS